MLNLKINFEISNRKKYKLIINCDPNHPFDKKFFSKKIEKNYNSYAYTTIIKHKKIKNNTAFQNFTKNGPISFFTNFRFRNFNSLFN